LTREKGIKVECGRSNLKWRIKITKKQRPFFSKKKATVLNKRGKKGELFCDFLILKENTSEQRIERDTVRSLTMTDPTWVSSKLATDVGEGCDVVN
jgi:hypothetical protein